MNDEGLRPAPLSWFTKSTFRYTPLILELMAIAIVLRLLGVVQPFIFQAIIDRVLPFQRETTLVLIVVILIVSNLFSAVLEALSAYLGNHLGNRLTAELARRIFDHVLNLPLRLLQRWQVGETLARVDEIDTVRSFLTGTVIGIVLDVLFALIYIGALLSISPFLTVVVLIILPLQIFAFGAIGPFIRHRMQESFLAGARHQARLVEAFGNIVTVKALASENLQVRRFQETLKESLFTSFRVTKLHITSGFIGDVLRNGATILTIFFGSRLVFQQEITLGELIAFNMLAEKVAGPIMSLSSLWEHWQGLKIARLRLGDFLNETTETNEDQSELQITGPLELHLDRVSFGYDPGHPVIRELSTLIDPGRPTVIVGASGCGKSTLAKLMCGLYTPDAGRVLARGIDLANCAPRSVRRAIAYLPQQPALFSGTILENLRMANVDASEAEIRQALVASASSSFVSELPGGIQFDVGEDGNRLSGGQRQRIALARALLTNPAALVLDEPTSALDPQSAAQIVETLRRLIRKTTLIIVTHNRTLLGDEPVTMIDLDHPEDLRMTP